MENSYQSSAVPSDLIYQKNTHNRLTALSFIPKDLHLESLEAALKIFYKVELRVK